MKIRKILLLGALAVPSVLLAQQQPTVNTGAGKNNQHYWSREGNSGNSNKINNIFGTRWNSPIYTITGGLSQSTYRTKLNGIYANGTQYPINGYGFAQGVNTTGYMLLGENGFTQTGVNQRLYQTKGAFSLLHLNGPSNASNGFVQEYGYRPWMKTGITYTGNNDLMYQGIRQIASPQDRTEFVTSWSDNSGANYPGPDDYAFRFIGVDNNAPTNYSADYNSENDIDGRHIARFTGRGQFALGPVFGVTAPGSPTYFRPTSQLHMAKERRKGVWLQQTNIAATGMSTNNGNFDGHRIGIERKPYFAGDTNTYAFYRWQENSAMIFQTDWNTGHGGIKNGERLRITTVGALSDGQDQDYNGLTAPNNTTRIAISHKGNNPVTRPMSLLHLGYNTGANSFPGVSTDGWRSWMDIGMFTSDGTDNMYVGLKSEGADRSDAVINWGDNQTSGSTPNGPDNLRFIFTSTTTATFGQGDSVSQSENGLELGRFYPDFNRTYPDFGDSTYGRFGVGDFTASGVNEDPTHKIDVIGNGRFRYLPDSIFQADSTVNKYVMVDSTGVLRWSDEPISGGVGNYCGATANPLTGDYEIPLNGSDYFFSGQGDLTNNVGVGFPCNTNMLGKFSVFQTKLNYLYSTTVGMSTAGYFHDAASSNAIIAHGLWGRSTGSSVYNIGGRFDASNGTVNYGVYSNVTPGTGLAGLFQGDVTVTGTFSNPSDSILKQNVINFDSSLIILNQLEPKTFEFKNATYPNMNLPEGHQYGLIAQDVEQILPSLISENISPAEYDSLGNLLYAEQAFKGLNYEQFIPILIGGIQEQQAQIESQDSIINTQDSLLTNLNDRLTSLENCLSGILPYLCELSNSAIQQNDEETQNGIVKELKIVLEDNASIILEQNVPNPFAEQTVIEYFIPEAVQKAQIHFYDMRGQLIRSVDIEEMGNGKLTVFANDLSTGTYTYTLVADGQIISTKKMVKTN